MNTWSKLAPAVLAGIVGMSLASCGGSSSSSSSGAASAPSTLVTPTRRPPPAGPFAVGMLTVVLVDTTRPTAAHADVPTEPDRDLVMTIMYPAVGSPGPAIPNAPADFEAGPFPLIVFAHGTAGEPADFGALFGKWAAAGFVVAAPEFPLTGEHVQGGSVDADYVNQPADVRFIIDQMLHSPPPGLDGLVDAGRIGVAGHSLGGITTMGLAFNSCCSDPRIKAVIVMSGAVPYPYPGGTYFGSVRSPPALFITGSSDQTVPPQSSVSSYNKDRPPKALVTIVGAGHSDPYEGNELTPEVNLVAQISIDWWNLYLEGREQAADMLDQTVKSSNGLATLQESGV
jgi:predicted dienelactone hydrolase